MHWLLVFGRDTGLAPAQLIGARRRDLRLGEAGWWIETRGRGGRVRQVLVSAAALAATRTYFASRGLDLVDAPPDTPLLAVLGRRAKASAAAAPVEAAGAAHPPEDEPGCAALSYATLQPAFARFVRTALARSDLPADRREAGLRASLLWLRNTHASSGIALDPKLHR
ncbi:MAG: hypothetical protein EOO24_06785 [Comamonadaceae bacterium]|nr:MAG: hypothetical protein EOO24_06785 [Comamonadaceae bacterium]